MRARDAHPVHGLLTRGRIERSRGRRVAHSVQFGTVNIRDDDTDETAESVLQQFSAEEQAEIVQMRRTPNLYARLASSLAPAVFGTPALGRL